MWRRLASLGRTIFRRSHMESDLADELRCHIAERADHLIQQGVPPGEALRTARLEFGAVEAYKEECRASRGAAWIDEFWRNLRYAGRSLHQRPGFAAIAILSLALGIGANVAVFSLFNRLVLTPLPVRDPQTLQFIYLTGSPVDRLSYPKFERLRDNFDLFETIFGWTYGDSYELNFEGRSRVIDVDMVTGNYFDSLGVHPASGRLLLPDDDRVGTSQGIVLSYRFWREFFGGEEGVVGRSIKLRNVTFEIVGIAPLEFLGLEPGSPPDAYLPYHAVWRFNPKHESYEGAMNFYTMGRLRPDVPVAVAQTELRERWPGLEPPDRPSFYNRKEPGYPLLRDGSGGYSPLRVEFSRALYVLMGLAAAVFLIACANLASLLIVRGIERTGETSVRLALGASRRQVIGHWMSECLLISGIGGAGSLVLARWISDLLLLFVREQDRSWLRFQPDTTVVTLAVGLTVTGGFLFGLLPAFQAWRLGIQGLIRAHSAAVIGRPGRAAQAILCAQVAAALVLAVSAGLFTKTLWKLSHTDPGVDTDGVAYALPEFWKTEFPRDRWRLVIDEAVVRLRSSPRISSVSEGWGLTFAAGMGATGWGPIRVPGHIFTPDEDNRAFNKWVAPGFFETLKIPLIEGRDFEARDRLYGSRPQRWPQVAIVNERFARHYFSGQNPIGREFQQGIRPPQRIIGVVGDTTEMNFREQPRELVYMPNRPTGGVPIIVRSNPGVKAEVAEAELRALFSSLAPGIPFESGTLESAVHESMRRDRLVAQLSSAFGALGMVLAAVGLYGSTAHMARSRRREIGLRIALGAMRFDVVRLMLRQNLWVTVTGVTIGLALALAAGRVIESLLFGINATDPLAFGVAALLLATVALAASLWPALRAARLDPSKTLRYE